MAWEKETAKTSAIAGERRGDRRYAIHLELKWKLVRRRRVLDSGTGHTVDLSSSGILLDVGRYLPEGHNLDLSISWPVLLHDVAPLRLSVTGRIVRSDGGKTAIQMVQHEFRTAGISADQRSALAAAPQLPGNVAPRVIAIDGFGKQ
jgi:hypothetical protein